MVAYQKDVSTDDNKLDGSNAVKWAQAVDNWEIAQENKATNNGSGSAGGLFTYSTSPQLRGNKAAAPATNPSGEASGNALGFFAVWSGVIQYTQTAKAALPAGHYELTYTYYNQGANSNIGENLIGFIEDGGTTHYGEKSFETGGWKTATITFNLTSETSGKFSIGIKSSGKGSADNAMLFVDNLKLTYNSFNNRSYANQSDNLLVNGSFDTANQGWTLTNMEYMNNSERPTQYIQKWQSSALTDTYTATQTVKNLPAGAYLLKATVNTNKDESGAVTLAVNDNSINCSGSWKDYEIVYNLTEAGDITVKFNSTNANSNWIACDGFSLTYGGDYTTFVDDKNKADYDNALTDAKALLDNTNYTNVKGSERAKLKAETEKTITSGYADATTSLNTLSDVFTAAKANYDYLADVNSDAKLLGLSETTITDETTAATALSAGHDLVVNMYSTVNTNYSHDLTSFYDKDWTSTLGSGSGQHWDGTTGTTGTTYQDANGTDITKTAEKTVTLPAGTYILKAAGRDYNSTLTMTVNNTDNTTVTFPSMADTGFGITTKGVASFADASEDIVYANNNKGRGWEWRYLPLTLTAETEVKITVSATTTGWGWFSFSDFTILADNSTATDLLAGETEYGNLKSAIKDAEAKTLGFEAGEYAPYNNVAAIKALAAAKAIDQTANNLKATVTAATNTLNNNVTWTPNPDEVNAIYDGSFEYEYDTSAGDVKPTGWHGNSGKDDAYDVRYMHNATKNAGITATNSNKCMMTKYNAYYGADEGYTLPLEANTIYRLTFKYCGWSNTPTTNIVITDADNNTIAISPSSFKPATSNGDSNADSWYDYDGLFTTGATGNYQIAFNKKESGQQQIGLGDFVLKKALLWMKLQQKLLQQVLQRLLPTTAHSKRVGTL